MENVHQARARFDSSFNSIAYSVVPGTGCSINTAEHFHHCGKMEYTALKGDIRPTADGGLIMCHDAGFTLNEDGCIVGFVADSPNTRLIRDLTTEQCLSLSHQNKDGDKVTDFDTYIRICKRYGKIAFITIRDEYIEDAVPVMFAVLDKYKMRKRCIVNSFTVKSLEAVRAVDADIMLSHVMWDMELLNRKEIDMAERLGNCLINTFLFPFKDYPEDANGDGVIDGFDALELSRDALEYAKEKDVRIYSAQNSKPSDIDRLMEYGIMGAQMFGYPI